MLKQCNFKSNANPNQSCYQGLSLRGQGQGQDFFLKAKAKDKKFSRPRQGHIISKPTSRPTETATITQPFALQLLRQNYTYLIKHMQKKRLVTVLAFNIENNV